MFRKYASAEIIAHSGQQTGRTAGKKRLGSFDYEPRDDHKYLYVAVRACTADVPNLNYDMLPSSELKGKEAYKTFIGSYVYLNHDNTDPLKARGAIIDAKYHDEDPDDQWVEILEELDEEKCPKLCSLIRSGEIDTVSMGCEVTSTTCSICGNEAEYPFEYCDHIKNKGQKYAGKMAYEICNGVDFFECSWVYNPADPTAYVQALDKTAKVAKKTSKNLNLGIADEDLEDAYYHFTDDLGYTPDVDDIIGQLLDWYGYDEPETDKEWGWLLGAVKEFLSRKKDVWLDQHGELMEDDDTALNPKYAVEHGVFRDSKIGEVVEHYMPEFEGMVRGGRLDADASLACACKAMTEYGLSRYQADNVSRELMREYYGIPKTAKAKNASVGRKVADDFEFCGLPLQRTELPSYIQKRRSSETYVCELDGGRVFFQHYMPGDYSGCDDSWSVYVDNDDYHGYGTSIGPFDSLDEAKRSILTGTASGKMKQLFDRNGIGDFSRMFDVVYGRRESAMKRKPARMKESVQTTFVPHWDMDYVTVEYTVYQCDDLENCRWVFFDYDFAMSHGFDFDKYRRIYHGHYDLRGPSSIPDWSDKQFLELLYTKWNTGKAPKDAWNMRSLSMSDIVELYGHYYYCDTFGWKEIDPYKKGETKMASKHADGGEKEDSFANADRKPDDISTKEKEDVCPLCDSPSFDGEYCDICGYQVPPDGFDDIKLEDDSDYEEYESESDSDDESEDVDMDEVEEEDAEEDEGYDMFFEDESEDDIDTEDSDDESEDDEKKKREAGIMYDIADDPQTYIGIAEQYGDYDLIGFDILKTDDYDLQIELEEAGAIEL